MNDIITTWSDLCEIDLDTVNSRLKKLGETPVTRNVLALLKRQIDCPPRRSAMVQGILWVGVTAVSLGFVAWAVRRSNL